MPLLEVTQSRKVSATIHLDDSTATQLDQYAAFIHSSADRVIEQALVYVFSKDREFQEYLKSPEAAAASPTLRIRKTARPPRAPEAPRTPVAATNPQPNGSARSSEARA